jgi:hypothetical protein
VKGYILIDISSDRLIIKRSFQFEESVSHVPQLSHANIFFLPPVRDDEHAHVEYSLDQIFDSKDSYDPYTKLVQSDVDSVHPDADSKLEQRPKWPKNTLQYAGDLVEDPVDTRRT